MLIGLFPILPVNIYVNYSELNANPELLSKVNAIWVTFPLFKLRH